MRPNSSKAPGYLTTSMQVQSRARMTDFERENHFAQAIQAARNELDDASAGTSVEKQLEHATAAIVQLLDAQAIAVAQMRANSRSWTEVGAALGLTKQAAQSRFGKSP